MTLAEPSFDVADLLAIAALVAFVTVIAFAAFLVAAGRDRSEGPEPRGQAIYLHLVILITMFVSVIAATAVVAALSQLLGTNTATVLPTGVTGIAGITGITGVTGLPTTTTLPSSLGPTTLHPIGDAAARGVVAGMIVLLVAGALFVTHWRQARRVREDPVLRSTNSGRVLQAYLNTATFVAVLTLIVTASLAGYAVFEAAAPGVAQASGHVAPLRGLVPLLFFTGANLMIMDRHWRVMRPLRGVPTPPPGANPPGGYPPGPPAPAPAGPPPEGSPPAASPWEPPPPAAAPPGASPWEPPPYSGAT